jgi:hypothetical protein
MIKVLFVVIGVLVYAVVTCIFIIKNQRQSARTLQCKNLALEHERDTYAQQVQRLTKAGKIAVDNRRESDAKVESLHNGDAVDNALHGLSDTES